MSYTVLKGEHALQGWEGVNMPSRVRKGKHALVRLG